MIYITTSPLGLFATDEKGNEVACMLFSKDPKIAKKQYSDSLKKELFKEENELIGKLKTSDLIFEIKKDAYKHIFPNPAGIYVRSNLLRLAQKNSFKPAEFNRFLYDINFEITADAMRNQRTDDKLIIQAVTAIDDLDKAINVMCMRLREWYGLYFPEASERISDNEKFAKYISETLYRTDINNISIEDTVGSEMKSDDLKEQKMFAQSIENLFAERKELEKYINRKCLEVIPNMTAIIGAEQASRILAHAGSTEKLAKFPSSTIQILGAEKALFRYLHNVGTSPKHGIIFNTGYIQRTPKDYRGKIARILASKLSLASKLDFYKGVFRGDSLRADMDKALEEVLKAKPKKDRSQRIQAQGRFQEKKQSGQDTGLKKDSRPPFQQPSKNKDRNSKVYARAQYSTPGRQSQPSQGRYKEPQPGFPTRQSPARSQYSTPVRQSQPSQDRYKENHAGFPARQSPARAQYPTPGRQSQPSQGRYKEPQPGSQDRPKRNEDPFRRFKKKKHKRR
ncbi:MAG: hypothetical protein ABIG84_02020 [archaeon]